MLYRLQAESAVREDVADASIPPKGGHVTYLRPVVELFVQLCMTRRQVYRFAIDEHVFDVRAKLERISIRHDQIRHLAYLNTSKHGFQHPRSEQGRW